MRHGTHGLAHIRYSFAMPETPQHLLKRVFGYDAFRDPQQAIVERLIAGDDCLVLMPTGGGKSLCFQIPSLLRDGVGIVVSPLIALMQDQVETLRQLGVRAAFLNSSLSARDAFAVERQLLDGELDLLYVAPERLLTTRFLDLLDQSTLALFAIDEAHCVSQWGHDFRPEYRQLDVLHSRWPRVPRIALTATADAPTRAEIAERLALNDAQWFISSFDRPNIRYSVVQKDNPKKQLLAFLENHEGQSGIVYCLSRKKVEDSAQFLAERGINALPYHAGLDAKTRAENQRRFLREEGIVMCATIAFGMGIDKPDVRFVAHLDLPKSIEGYYQETGRAGRDGDPAYAFLCYGLADLVTLKSMIEEGDASEERKLLERRKLDALLGYCEATRCRRQVLLANFDEVMEKPCGNCDNCLEPPRTYDGTQVAQKALSCVYRTGQRFGVNYVIDVLRGADNDRITQFGHNQLSTFGIGAEVDANQWRSVFRQLAAHGLIDVDVQGYGALHLTDAARPLLRGETTLQLRRDLAVREPGKRAGRSTAKTTREPRRTTETLSSPAAEDRFKALRQLRAQLAKEQNVPPYVIFHDAHLRDIAEHAPTSMEELGQVKGVGTAKLARYGEAVLEALGE